MTGPSHRLPSGGLIDRSRRLSFTFDGRPLTGHPGDTLASALLANGVRLVGRSFKYHRPRGLVAAGPDEPNGLVELRDGARREPNVKATTAELYDGLLAASQNRWPSLALDLMAVNGLFKPMLAAGFYYKTFMWPKAFWERLYEPAIRRAAGLGQAAPAADPDRYERVHATCDLLVVGAGPAGLMAALTAGRAGARVVLVEDDMRLGGHLLVETAAVDDLPAPAFAELAAAELASLPNVQVLTRTAAVAAFDHGTLLALERVGDHKPAPGPGEPRQRLWSIVARRTIVAAGALERPIVFPGNDRPGVMLAGAVRTYANRYGVAAGRRIAVHTATDAGWLAARDLLAAGLVVEAVIETRPTVPSGFDDVAARVRVIVGGTITGTQGSKSLTAITVLADGRSTTLAADTLAVSGGFNPQIQLMSHFGQRPTWDDRLAGFVPSGVVHGLEAAGAAAGHYDLAAVFADGARAARAALEDLGLRAPEAALPRTGPTPTGLGTAFRQPGRPSAALAFIDQQHDVTAADVELAHREGYVSVEHLKRYTTLGMATDQGRTSAVDGLALLAAMKNEPIGRTGVTLARPPTVPLSIGAVAGAHRGAAFRPVREVPIAGAAASLGAVFVNTGLWRRPQYFPRAGETSWLETVNREVTTVRSAVGVTDVSTLGKIEVEGPDAAAFLDRVYANRPGRIPVGRARYALMLREDGFLFDDGTVIRLAEDHFVASVSTAHAPAVWRHMLFARQVLFPRMRVALTAVTDAYAQFAIAGPKSPAVVSAVVDGPPVTAGTFPPMAAGAVTVLGGVPGRLAAVSFSGERAFELAVPAAAGTAVFHALLEAGAPHGIVAYGTEAMAVMRIEKGHPAGAEINGQTTAHDLGLSRLLASDKDHIGRVLSQRRALTDPGRPRLVGLRPLDPETPLKGGAHVLSVGAEAVAENDEGWITSSAYSPTLGTPIALALVRRGPERWGETVRVWDGLRGTDHLAQIVAPCFVDPEGHRTHAG